MRIIIFGPPGSGKGTYASILESKLGILKINSGDILREIAKSGTELGKKIAEYQNKGELVPDDIVIEIIKERLLKPDCSKGYILDGYPRTIQQAEALEKISSPHVIINLIVPQRVIIARLSGRLICPSCNAIYHKLFLKPKTDEICDKCGAKLIQREDDKPEVIKERLKVYRKQSKPLIEYYKNKKPIGNVRCNKVDIPPEKVVEKILEKLKELGFLKG
ncbi:MAG: adenylate kinase [Candidatus Aenigmarchaeota archaeon]|nr:adenylate kinase [Candidatus Aenigmarchaeota archaeon]